VATVWKRLAALLWLDIQITLQQGNTGDGVETSSQLLKARRSHYISKRQNW